PAGVALSFGDGLRPVRMALTARATWRLASLVAAANPTEVMAVFVPTPPARPDTTVPRPSASTPRVIDCMSGRSQFASFVRWHTAMVPVAFIAAATAAIANGAIKAASNDQDRLPNDGNPISGAWFTTT